MLYALRAPHRCAIRTCNAQIRNKCACLRTISCIATLPFAYEKLKRCHISCHPSPFSPITSFTDEQRLLGFCNDFLIRAVHLGFAWIATILAAASNVATLRSFERYRSITCVISIKCEIKISFASIRLNLSRFRPIYSQCMHSISSRLIEFIIQSLNFRPSCESTGRHSIRLAVGKTSRE